MRLRCRICDWRTPHWNDRAWEELDSHMLRVHRYDGTRYLDEEKPS